MKRLILAGLCCAMLAGCTNANPDSISEGEAHLGEVLDQTGHSFSYVSSGSELTAGLYTDGEEWFLTSVRTVKGQQDPVITDQPMRQAETGSDGIQLWYGVYGSPEEPWLALQLTETEPTCRSLGISGEERSLELTNSLGEPVEWMTEPLEGLLDSENRLTVTLADVDLKQVWWKNKGDNTPDAKILSGLARPMCLIDGKGERGVQNTEQNAVLLRLAREYGDSVVRMCCVYLKDYHLAQDVAQETFLQAWGCSSLTESVI